MQTLSIGNVNTVTKLDAPTPATITIECQADVAHGEELPKDDVIAEPELISNPQIEPPLINPWVILLLDQEKRQGY